MTIIRVVALDPAPRSAGDDLITWQVPENSRSLKLLLELLEDRNIEYDIVEFKPRKKTRCQASRRGEGEGEGEGG